MPFEDQPWPAVLWDGLLRLLEANDMRLRKRIRKVAVRLPSLAGAGAGFVRRPKVLGAGAATAPSPLAAGSGTHIIRDVGAPVEVSMPALAARGKGAIR